MIETALKEYFKTTTIISAPEYELRYVIIKSRKNLFGTSLKLLVNALIIFNSKEINFKGVVDAMLKSLQNTRSSNISSIKCHWIICSESGGIYLYEALATNEHKSFKGIKSSFIVINSLDATVSLGPGHILNHALSSKMKDLLEEYRKIPRAQWTIHFNDLIDSCLLAQKN